MPESYSWILMSHFFFNKQTHGPIQLAGTFLTLALFSLLSGFSMSRARETVWIEERMYRGLRKGGVCRGPVSVSTVTLPIYIGIKDLKQSNELTCEIASAFGSLAAQRGSASGRHSLHCHLYYMVPEALSKLHPESRLARDGQWEGLLF